MVTTLFTAVLATTRCLYSKLAFEAHTSINTSFGQSQRHLLAPRRHRSYGINTLTCSRAKFNCRQRRNFGAYRALVRTGFTTSWAVSPGFRRFTYVLGGGVLCFLGYGMERTPVTGRWRFNCIPGFLLEYKAEAVYQQALQEFGDKVQPPTTAEAQYFHGILERLLSSVHSIGVSAEGYRPWTLQVIQTEEVNALILPGRHIFVFTGILPFLRDDDSHYDTHKTAALLSHEIAHHVSHHAAETVSSYAALLAATWLATFVFNVSSHSTHNTLDVTYLRRNSRTQESEADHLGLLIMAAAGYDPRAAVEFWSGVHQAEQPQVAEYLRTHPSSDTRSKQIQSWMPDALKVLNRSATNRAEA